MTEPVGCQPLDTRKRRKGFTQLNRYHPHMKTLYLMRHAKSSWKESDLADFDRPLNERGRRAAPFMGKVIAERGMSIDRIASSTAKRARRTAKLFKEAAAITSELVLDDRIYEASPSTLLYVVSETDDQVDSLMLVGHNPGMEGTIRVLTGEAEPMPTAAIAIINLEIDSWKEISAGTGKLQAVVRPRDEMEEN